MNDMPSYNDSFFVQFVHNKLDIATKYKFKRSEAASQVYSLVEKLSKKLTDSSKNNKLYLSYNGEILLKYKLLNSYFAEQTDDSAPYSIYINILEPIETLKLMDCYDEFSNVTLVTHYKIVNKLCDKIASLNETDKLRTFVEVLLSISLIMILFQRYV
jgi:hypothetical protein